MSELKPCPFCGTDAYFDNDQDCGCVRCGLENFDVDTWNTRPLESALQSALTTAQEEAEYQKRKKKTIFGLAKANLTWSREKRRELQKQLDIAQEENKRYKDALEEIKKEVTSEENKNEVKSWLSIYIMAQSALNGGKNERG